MLTRGLLAEIETSPVLSPLFRLPSCDFLLCYNTLMPGRAVPSAEPQRR